MKPNKIRLNDCSELYNCCSCGGNDCGCSYCFDCKACENCQSDDATLQCLNVRDSTWAKYKAQNLGK